MTEQLGDPVIQNSGTRAAPAPPSITRLRSHVLVLGLYSLLTALMTWPLVRNLTSAIPGDGFDGWQNYWNQWWIKIALVDRLQSPFHTDLLYYPTGVGLYFHTLNPFNGITTLPIQLSAGLILAYNAVIFGSWVLGGYGLFLLARWVLRASGNDSPGSGSTLRALAPPFLAGTIYTFSPFHMAHLLGHMQVLSLEWLPFYILYLLRATQRIRQSQAWRRDALLAGFFLVLVGLCDWYYVLYLFLFTGLYLVWQWGRIGLALAHRRPGISSDRALLAVPLPALTAGLLFLVLLSPILVPMIREALQFKFMQRPVTDLYILSASVMDFLIPNRLHTLFRPQSFRWIGNQIAPVSERTISVGYLPLLLALFAAWQDRRRSGFWLASALFFLLMALGPALHAGNIGWEDVPSATPAPSWTPYGLLNRLIPFMRISRSVSRFAVMVQLSVALAAAIGLQALLGIVTSQGNERTAPRLHRAIAGLCLLVVLAEFWVAPFPLSPPDTPDYYTNLAAQRSDWAVLNLPMNFDRPGYLLYQTVHHKPLTVAYISRDDPRTLTERVPVLQHFRHLGPDIIDVDAASVGPTILDDLGVETVVLDRYKMPGGRERTYTTALAQAIFAGQPPVYEDERLTVFTVSPPDIPRPYLVLGATHWGPYHTGASGQPSRTLGTGLALLHFRHVPPAAQLHIRYRTQPGASARVVLPGTTLTVAVLPPAPAGNEIVLDLGKVHEAGTGGDLAAIGFLAEQRDSVTIKNMTLTVP